MKKLVYTTNVKANIDKTISNSITVQKNGYAYIYFTNESDKLAYLDSFILSHEKDFWMQAIIPFGFAM